MPYSSTRPNVYYISELNQIPTALNEIQNRKMSNPRRRKLIRRNQARTWFIDSFEIVTDSSSCETFIGYSSSCCDSKCEICGVSEYLFVASATPERVTGTIISWWTRSSCDFKLQKGPILQVSAVNSNTPLRYCHRNQPSDQADLIRTDRVVTNIWVLWQNHPKVPSIRTNWLGLRHSLVVNHEYRHHIRHLNQPPSSLTHTQIIRVCWSGTTSMNTFGLKWCGCSQRVKKNISETTFSSIKQNWSVAPVTAFGSSNWVSLESTKDWFDWVSKVCLRRQAHLQKFLSFLTFDGSLNSREARRYHMRMCDLPDSEALAVMIIFMASSSTEGSPAWTSEPNVLVPRCCMYAGIRYTGTGITFRGSRIFISSYRYRNLWSQKMRVIIKRLRYSFRRTDSTTVSTINSKYQVKNLRYQWHDILYLYWSHCENKAFL